MATIPQPGWNNADDHDWTTGLIELSLAELQAFRAILALRRSGS